MLITRANLDFELFLLDLGTNFPKKLLTDIPKVANIFCLFFCRSRRPEL